MLTIAVLARAVHLFTRRSVKHQQDPQCEQTNTPNDPQSVTSASSHQEKGYQPSHINAATSKTPVTWDKLPPIDDRSFCLKRQRYRKISGKTSKQVCRTVSLTSARGHGAVMNSVDEDRLRRCRVQRSGPELIESERTLVTLSLGPSKMNGPQGLHFTSMAPLQKPGVKASAPWLCMSRSLAMRR